MAVLVVLLAISLLPALGYLFVPISQRKGPARALPFVSVVLVASLVLFVVAVNVGWVSP